jgi:hypothetical protein
MSMRSRRQEAYFEETTAQSETAAFGLVEHENQRRRRALRGVKSSMSASRPNRLASAQGMRHLVSWSSRRTRQSAPWAQIRDGRKKRNPSSWGLPSYSLRSRCGSIQNMVAALVDLARLPNPSVNLTRNSTPRWPSEARYAHNAPLVHRVALPRAGYLKR